MPFTLILMQSPVNMLRTVYLIIMLTLDCTAVEWLYKTVTKPILLLTVCKGNVEYLL